MRVAGGIALLVLLACGCSSSPGPAHPDGGAGVGGFGGGSGGSHGGHGGAVKPPDGGTTDARPDADASCSSANRDNGLACSCSAQCKSKFCVEGYCCNSACQGTCQTCSQAMSLGTCTMVAAGVKPSDPSDCHVEASTTCGQDGTCDGKGGCRLYSLGTVCTAGTCQGAEIAGTRVCDGSGACRAGAINVCAPFLCSTTTNQCKTTCTGDGDCVSPVKCLGGSCGPKALGAHCGGDSECDSKHCADGVCCNTACGGACQSCNQVASPGTCTPTPAGQPHPLCPKQDPTTCGTTGMCDGQGGCPRYPVNTACGQAVCTDAISGKSTQTCDGLGTCLPAKTFTCGNFACAGGACTEYCASQADCAPGHTCTVATGGTVGTCGKKVDGQTCTADADCVNGHCADGVCCCHHLHGRLSQLRRPRLARDLHLDRRGRGRSARRLQGPDGGDVLDGRQVRRRGRLPEVPDGNRLRARELLGEQLHGAVDVQQLRDVYQAERHHLRPVSVQRHRLLHRLQHRLAVRVAQHLRNERCGRLLRDEAQRPALLEQ